MKSGTEKIRDRVIALIESEYDSDASFEREMGLAQKTVSNWRRGRSSSFMSILPDLSERYNINLGEFYDMPIKADSSELSGDEMEILTMYRKAQVLPKKMRMALKETIESTINMYIAAGSTAGKRK